MSVVIPSYNRAGVLGEAIRSVLGQTGVHMEVIVVDDGSTDNTKEIVKAFGTDVHYVHQANTGASAARNTGIRHAATDLIAFLDSDDLWLPGKLAQQCRELRDTGAIAHLTDVIVERPFADKLSLMALRGMQHHFEGTDSRVFERPLTLNVRYNFARTQSILVRRDHLLEAGLYDTAYRFFEDTDLMNRLALQGAWCVSPTAFVREIRRDESIEALGEENRRKPQIGQEALVQQMRTLLSDDRITSDERAILREFLGKYAYTAGKYYLKAAETRQARALFREGWKVARSRRCLAARGIATLPAPLRALAGF